MTSLREICADLVETQRITHAVNAAERALNTGRRPDGPFERSYVRLHRHMQLGHSQRAQCALVGYAAANDCQVNPEVA